MTKYTLMKLLFDGHGGQANWWNASNGKRYFGVLQAVEREDGSGNSFNVTVLHDGKPVTFHIRTCD